MLVIVILETDFFERKFGVHLSNGGDAHKDHNDPQLHMIVYLQVAIISQALIFVTRSHGFFFMERPSTALLVAFALAQLISSIIASFADWGFTKIHSVSAGWIGIVWVWVCRFLLQCIISGVSYGYAILQNIVWFIPLDWIKFAMKATAIKYLRERRLRLQAKESAATGGVPLTRTQSRAASLYSNRTSFLTRAARKVGFGNRAPHMTPHELERLASIQAHVSGATLARNPSRPT